MNLSTCIYNVKNFQLQVLCFAAIFLCYIEAMPANNDNAKATDNNVDFTPITAADASDGADQKDNADASETLNTAEQRGRFFPFRRLFLRKKEDDDLEFPALF